MAEPQSPDQAFDSPIYWYISGKPGLFLTYLQCYRHKSQIRPKAKHCCDSTCSLHRSDCLFIPTSTTTAAQIKETEDMSPCPDSTLQVFRMDNQLLPHLTPSTCSQSAPDRQIQIETRVQC